MRMGMLMLMLMGMLMLMRMLMLMLMGMVMPMLTPRLVHIVQQAQLLVHSSPFPSKCLFEEARLRLQARHVTMAFPEGLAPAYCQTNDVVLTVSSIQCTLSSHVRHIDDDALLEYTIYLARYGIVSPFVHKRFFFGWALFFNFFF